MKCEIEFLPVGSASKAGDAIVVRYGEPHDFKLMLIDGGHAETGEQIVTHLRTQYGADAVLEHVALTHSDGDHASGLRTVLQQVPARNLWLHVPWEHAEQARHLFKGQPTADSLRRRIKAEYDIISEVVEHAEAQGTVIRGIFAGADVGPFKVLSPSLHAYTHLLPQFDKTPDPDQAAIAAANMWLGKATLADKFLDAARTIVHAWTNETWYLERLRDGGVTSASNESSAVLYGLFDRGPVLLTGDAGINALHWAAMAAEAYGLPLRRFDFVQVPHHGSRHNMGPEVLTRLLGGIGLEGSPPRFTAIASAPVDTAKHPRQIVLNAFMRRGATVAVTRGESVRYMGGFPGRYGDVAAATVPFSTVVEEYT